MRKKLDKLVENLTSLPRLAVAVSGGVDSLTLAFVASRAIDDFMCLHAKSPAVPDEATDRVIDYSIRFGWSLEIIESGEFSDPHYLKNPHNRCYFCKTNLFTGMRQRFDGPLATGTNLDDLGDYRPGLVAAKEFGILQPYVDAEIGKDDLREIAHQFGLSDISSLPAQPCLASRIITGRPISPDDLQFVDRMETQLRRHSKAKDIRCRVTHEGVIIEADNLETEALKLVEIACSNEARPFLGLRPYKRGSAFIRANNDISKDRG